MKFLIHICTLAALAILVTDASLHAQSRRTAVSRHTDVGASAVWGERPGEDENALRYIVEGSDTIYIDNLRPSKVYSRLPRQKGREWRKYYRLVHNFSKAYPYALVARKLVQEADSTIAADRLGRVKREKYVEKVQKEI